ncbi:MAG: hypothetical protein HY246_04730 [Proteobacteria bacterium]|nr:hypothetical protein [Pseudomonadota bacterium]
MSDMVFVASSIGDPRLFHRRCSTAMLVGNFLATGSSDMFSGRWPASIPAIIAEGLRAA